MSALLKATAHIRKTLESEKYPKWTLGFSGGKDSSAILCLIYSELIKFAGKKPTLEILYCDTRTENPIVDSYVKKFLRRIKLEALKDKLDIRVVIVTPKYDQTFFARVLGRGYPPPTNSFRWCTTNLRIRPVERYLLDRHDALVILGVRENESKQRDRYLSTHTNKFWMKADSANSRIYYTPIRALNTEDVWDAIFFTNYPRSLPRDKLWNLYADAGGDCPIVKSPDASPCASGRFGCWTCTVVRRDKSGESLLKKGHLQMEDFLKFRQLLLDVRNNPKFRWPRRRRGHEGLGPLTIQARKKLLAALKKIEAKHFKKILHKQELKYISDQWKADRAIEKQLLKN
ncbi:MAG TPA: phosphoadenosine phosphosulfate reductase family protein [Xanthobacteraceae bacterium]|nr:phosphoadenosine phosphosulfate reductase family protein [Xanthobacteraceae bacterium]